MEMILVLFFGGCCFCILVFENLILQLGVFYFIGQGGSEEVVRIPTLTDFTNPIPRLHYLGFQAQRFFFNSQSQY